MSAGRDVAAATAIVVMLTFAIVEVPAFLIFLVLKLVGD